MEVVARLSALVPTILCVTIQAQTRVAVAQPFALLPEPLVVRVALRRALVPIILCATIQARTRVVVVPLFPINLGTIAVFAMELTNVRVPMVSCATTRPTPVVAVMIFPTSPVGLVDSVGWAPMYASGIPPFDVMVIFG